MDEAAEGALDLNPLNHDRFSRGLSTDCGPAIVVLSPGDIAVTEPRTVSDDEGKGSSRESDTREAPGGMSSASINVPSECRELVSPSPISEC